MKYFLIVALILSGASLSFAQNRFGLETGVSAPVFTVGNDGDGKAYRHSAVLKPTISLSYLRKIDRHVYLGASLGHEAYDFYFSMSNDTKEEIRHFSSYFTFSPTVDFGLGRHQYIHIYVATTMGFQTNANEQTSVYATGTATDPERVYDSSPMVSGFFFRPGFGLKQHFPINKFWHITLNEGYSVLMTDLTHVGAKGAVHPAYLMFQLGVMRKFHKPLHPAHKD